MVSLFYLLSGLSLTFAFWLPSFAFLLLNLVPLGFLAAAFYKYGELTTIPAALSPEASFSVTILSFSILMVLNTGLRHCSNGPALVVLRFVLVGAVGIATYIAWYYLNQRDSRWEITPARMLWAFRSLMIACFASRVLTLYCSPSPDNEIFKVATIAAREFLEGINPYNEGVFAAPIRESFGPSHASAGHFAELPGGLYWSTPFFGVFSDIRVGMIMADVGVVMALGSLARVVHVKTSLRWLMPLAWLCFPTNLSVLETGSYEPILVLGTALMVLGVFMGHWVFAGICLGILSSLRSYAMLFAAFSVVWVFVVHGRKSGMKFLLSGLVSFTICLVPFLSGSGAGPIWRRSFEAIFSPGEAALTVPSLVSQGLHHSLPIFAMVALYLAGFSGFVSLLWKRRFDYQRRVFSQDGLTQSLLILYLAFFLFSYGASNQHYYFVSFLALLCLAVSLHRFRLTS